MAPYSALEWDWDDECLVVVNILVCLLGENGESPAEQLAVGVWMRWVHAE